MPSNTPLQILFDNGTLLLNAPRENALPLPDGFVYDTRVDAWRGEAFLYAPLLLNLHDAGVAYDDQARAYNAIPSLELATAYPPRPYQQEAIQHWIAAGRQGVIVLPTGTGKSFVAQLAMKNVKRSTLVVVPTLDLVEQWARQLNKAFGQPIGILGGGSKSIEDITVSTYDSAVLMMESIGNRFGLLIVDECHHLPGPAYQTLARFSIAPLRLGLTATPERPDGDDALLDSLLGPICYRRDITEFEGTALAHYQTQRISVPLSPQEEAAYQSNRAIYIGFIHQNRINLSARDGWTQFIRACARTPRGRDAMEAYLAQRAISRTCESKLAAIWDLLCEHAHERIIIFTADNSTAYRIGQRFCLPVLTHHTKIQERRDLLDAFRNGELPCIVTSKILNEGVDVPEASVGIVISGSGSIREHVQRLGRILRPSAGKRALLYELVSEGTGEWNVSERRRQHTAYGH